MIKIPHHIRRNLKWPSSVPRVAVFFFFFFGICQLGTSEAFAQQANPALARFRYQLKVRQAFENAQAKAARLTVQKENSAQGNSAQVIPLHLTVRSAKGRFLPEEIAQIKSLLASVGGHVNSVLPGLITIDLLLSATDALANFPQNVASIELNFPDEPLMNRSRSAAKTGGGFWLGTLADSVHALGYTGRGVVVGVIDFGFSALTKNSDFLGANGHTRIAYVWDQDASGTPPSSPAFSYGREWDSTAIQNNASNRSFGNASSHGTNCTGIAAGDGSASGQKGMAPDAKIILVSLKNTDGTSTNTIDAFTYIITKAAALGMPVSINYSLGSNFGAHDGSRDTEQAISALAGPGKLFSVAAGNNRGLNVHVQGTVPSGGEQSIGFNITTTTFSGHIWYSGSDSLGVSLIAPGGTTYGPFLLIPDSSQKADGGNILVYHSDYAVNGDREIQFLIQNKSGQTGWQVRLSDLRGTGCPYDGWRIGGAWTSHTTTDKNITTPSTADSALCVAACNVATGTIYTTSSQGPTRTGKQKPEITAPTNVSTTAGTLTGTSAASPHLAGLGAILLQARPTLSVKAFMSALTDSAHHDAATGTIPPHNINWGFGKLYSLGALQHVLPRSNEAAAINGVGKYLWRDQTGYAVLLNFSSESIDAVKADIFPGTSPPFAGSRKAVARYITLTPIGGTTFNATLRMYYTDSEVSSAGLTESNLQLYRYDSDTHTWTRMGGTMNALQNYVELSGVTAFSSWAISDPNSDNPLPVEFKGLSAAVSGDKVRLRWQTLSESENMGFTIERCAEGESFSLLSDYRTESGLQSKGLAGGNYIYDDTGLDAGTYFYRLSSHDVNGTRHELQTVRVEVSLTGQTERKFAYQLYQNYPNPFNPETIIQFDIEAKSTLTIEVFNLLGQRVAVVMKSKTVDAGKHSVKFNAKSLPSGVYFYRMQVWPQTGQPRFFTKKMLLSK